MSLGALWGLRYRRWEVGQPGLVACGVKLLEGRRPTTQRAHASAAPDTKPDHDLHGGAAVCVHIFINAKVTISMCKHVCTQPKFLQRFAPTCIAIDSKCDRNGLGTARPNYKEPYGLWGRRRLRSCGSWFRSSSALVYSILCLCLIRPGRHPKNSVFENSGGRI
jgi:hypothetical protein